MNGKVRTIKTVCALCGIIALMCGSQTLMAGPLKIKSGWDSTAIQVDGKSADWNGIPATFLPDQNAAIAVANDGKFIYLLFRTNDRRTARVIKFGGLAISLDPRGGKNRDFQLRFRGGPSREELGRPTEGDKNRGYGRDQSGSGPELEDQRPAFTCIIKNRIAEKEIPQNGTEGPAVAFDTSMGFFTYEFRIPLTRDSVRYYGIDDHPGDKVGISLVWGDMNNTDARHEGGGMHVGMGGIGGPGGTGGERGPGGGGNWGGREGGHRPEPPKKQEVWLKTTLAETNPK